MLLRCFRVKTLSFFQLFQFFLFLLLLMSDSNGWRTQRQTKWTACDIFFFTSSNFPENGWRRLRMSPNQKYCYTCARVLPKDFVNKLTSARVSCAMWGLGRNTQQMKQCHAKCLTVPRQRKCAYWYTQSDRSNLPAAVHKNLNFAPLTRSVFFPLILRKPIDLLDARTQREFPKRSQITPSVIRFGSFTWK